MKIALLSFSLLLLTVVASSQSVGIGTRTPSPNAILDISSNNKALMLPRVNDTSVIANPTAGLFVYDKNTNMPSYYNGSQWHALSSLNAASTNDSITYTLAGGAELPIKSFYQSSNYTPSSGGGSGTTVTTVGDIAFSKNFDINTNDLTKSTFTQSHFTNIEFKFYKPGSSGPYYSIKASTVAFVNYNYLQTASSAANVETYGVHFDIIGFKDWVNSKSFAFNVNTRTVVSY